jgi:hypothetical protein
MEVTLPVFHPGIDLSKKNKKKKAKKSKKVKKVKTASIVKPKPQYKTKKSKVPFLIFTGCRYTLPPTYTTSKEVAYLFHRLSTLNLSKMYDTSIHIENNHKFPSFTGVFARIRWNPPECVKEAITTAHIKRSTEWNEVREIITKLQKIYGILNRFIHQWRSKRILKKVKNIEDVVTLEVPKYPVYILDYKRGCSFVYEALTLMKLIESRLLTSEYMFSNPLKSVNPLTNEPLSISQLYSVTHQLFSYGRYSWIIDRYRRFGFNLHLLEQEFSEALKLNAIRNYFTKEKDASWETVIEVFMLMADSYEYMKNDYITKNYIKGMIQYSRDDPHTVKWYRYAMEYYIATETSNTAKLLLLTVYSHTLLEESCTRVPLNE